MKKKKAKSKPATKAPRHKAKKKKLSGFVVKNKSAILRQNVIAKEKQSRNKDIKRKRAVRAMAQDIGDIPEVKNPKRRERALNSLKDFAEVYFPAMIYFDWSPDHLKVLGRIDTVANSGGQFAYAMPRHSGKTTLACIGALYAICKGIRRYVCLLGSAATGALNLLQIIQTTILHNDLLLADCPEIFFPMRCLENNAHKQKGQRYKGQLTNPIWGTHKIVFAHIPGSPAAGAVITTQGMDSNLRGQIHTTNRGEILRPDMVLVDDPQTRESAKSPEQTNYRLKIINGDVLGLAGPGKKIAALCMCTQIYEQDLAEQILDRKKSPDWFGEKMKMLYKFPTNMKLWDEYSQVRAEGLRTEGSSKDANEFYKKNRAAMDEGHHVAWAADFNEDELSALQHAMNLYYANETAFFAEYQNEPLPEFANDDKLTAEMVMNKINGRPRGEVPLKAQYLVGFEDVHDKVLYWGICAFEDDFTGYLVDYGTYPEQNRYYFAMRDARQTLDRIYPGLGIEGQIQRGLETLSKSLISQKFKRAGGQSAAMQLERLLCDSSYKPGTVENVRHIVGQVMMASKGIGITAAKKPISTYIKKPGERFGHHWYIPNVARSQEFPHIKIDTNYWKTFVHNSFKAASGDRGSFTIFGNNTGQHKMLAEHIAESETSVKTEAMGRVVSEWFLRPKRPDNHLFDVIVGCFAAASMLGAKAVGQAEGQKPKKKVKLSDLQRQRKLLR
jgi:hypothetical protein